MAAVAGPIRILPRYAGLSEVTTITRIPDRIIVMDVVRRNRVGRTDRQDSPHWGHEISPEMSLLATEQSGEIAKIPGRIRSHLAVNTQNEASGPGCVFIRSAILDSGQNSQPISFDPKL